MGSYERMIRLLKSTGLYRLDGSTAVETEIGLYAAFFDEIEAEIGTLLDNCFPDSMTAGNFELWRKLYAFPQSLFWVRGKEMIQKRLALTNNDFTPAGVKKCMASGGFQVGLTEHFGTGEVTITIREDSGAFSTRAEKEAFLRECLPCHVKPVFVWEAG